MATPHIDSVTPDHGFYATEVRIQGSGFRPNATYVRAVMFEFAGDGTTRHAAFSHVVENGQIRDDQLIATVPVTLTPGGAYMWVENIEILPPAPFEPKPGEVEPPLPPEPQYNLYRSNRVLFVIDCLPPSTRVTEATLPDGVRAAVEEGILELQTALGGSLPVPGVENITHDSGACLGYRTKELKARVEFDSVATSWSETGLWTITLTASLRARAKLDVKTGATACHWARWRGGMRASGGGHRWDFTVSVCSRKCDADTTPQEKTFRLWYVSSAFHMGSMTFVGVPSWTEGGLRDRVEGQIRASTLGRDSPLLEVIRMLCEAAYRTHVGGDCPGLGLGDICAAVATASAATDREEVLRPLRAFRSSVLEGSATGRTLSRLWNVVSPDLVRVMRGDPVVWGEAASLLRELSRAVDEAGPARRVVLTRERHERVLRLFERSRTRLSPVTVAVAEAVLPRLDRFVGRPASEVPASLARWKLPGAVARLVDRLRTPRHGVHRRPRPSPRRQRRR